MAQPFCHVAKRQTRNGCHPDAKRKGPRLSLSGTQTGAQVPAAPSTQLRWRVACPPPGYVFQGMRAVVPGHSFNFNAQPPNLPPVPLMVEDFAISCPLARRHRPRISWLTKLLPLHYPGKINASGIFFHVDELLLSGPEPGLSLIHLQPHIVSLVASAGGLLIFPSIL